MRRSLWFVYYRSSPLSLIPAEYISLDGELKRSLVDTMGYFDMLPTEEVDWVCY